MLVDQDGDGHFPRESGADPRLPERFSADGPVKAGDQEYTIAEMAVDGSRLVLEEAEGLEAFVPGFTCPDFTVELLEGGSLSLSALRGKVVVVNWWATSCGPCIAEMPALSKLVGRYADHPQRGQDVFWKL